MPETKKSTHPRHLLNLTDREYEQLLLTASGIFHTFKCTPEHLHTPAIPLATTIIRQYLADIVPPESKALMLQLRIMIPHVAAQQAIIEKECPIFVKA